MGACTAPTFVEASAPAAPRPAGPLEAKGGLRTARGGFLAFAMGDYDLGFGPPPDAEALGSMSSDGWTKTTVRYPGPIRRGNASCPRISSRGGIFLPRPRPLPP